MFTEDRREALLGALVERARADGDVVGAALVGSAARGELDRWSDIDLALGLRAGVEPLAAAERWEADLRALTSVAGVLDLWSGPALYRVLLLADSLQVDLSFWPAGSFRSTGQPFRLLFGEAAAADEPAPADPGAEVGWAWLHALHARSAIARGRDWQALEMLGGLRDRVVALACLRHGLPPFQGRGVDRLPAEERAALLATVPASVDGPALAGALRAALDLLAAEAAAIDPALAASLRRPLAELAASAVPPGG